MLPTDSDSSRPVKRTCPNLASSERQKSDPQRHRPSRNSVCVRVASLWKVCRWFRSECDTDFHATRPVYLFEVGVQLPAQRYQRATENAGVENALRYFPPVRSTPSIHPSIHPFIYSFIHIRSMIRDRTHSIQ